MLEHAFNDELECANSTFVTRLYPSLIAQYSRKVEAMPAKMYGYARVSSKDKNLDRQILAFEEFGIERCSIFSDKAIGKDFRRPQYQRLIKRLHKGDILVIKSIDCLGRNGHQGGVGQRYRHVHRRFGAAATLLCRADRAREHPSASG